MKKDLKLSWNKAAKRLPLFISLTTALCLPATASQPINDVIGNNYAQTVTQTRIIKGIISDENGEPMIGVSILVKGTSIGTITNLNGEYTLEVPAGNKTLEVSYIGYKTQLITLGADSQVNVKLVPDTQTLDEIVVIGYGAVKKRDLTGAVTSIKSEDIAMNPGTNPMEALQGKVAGLDIMKSSGQAGAGVSMQLRGTRSFTASGDPTFIIDGMPGDYSTLNPNDIESIEVLKDASSTAVYGSSGANGVIIVTTKNGKAGKVNVNFNAYAGFNGWSKTPTMRSGDSYLQTLRDANAATGNWSSPADDEKIFASAESYQAHLNGDYINWADELMQNGMTQNYSLSVSGGSEKTKGYISLNFSDEKGQYTGDNYKVYSTNIRVDHNIRNWLKIGTNLQASYVHQNKAFAKLETALSAEPLGKIKDENGNYTIEPVIGSTMINLLLNNQKNVYKNQDQNFKMYFNPYIEVTPLKGLSVISRIGVTLQFLRNNYFQGEGSYQYYSNSGPLSKGTNDQVYAAITQSRNYNYKWENIITYNFKIKDVHDFTVTGVTSWNHDQYDKSYMKQTHIDNNKFLWNNMDAQSKNSFNETSYNMSKGMAYVGRLNYSFMGKYLFSASVRHDGSSKLASGNRWNTFPAVALGWRISDEKFMEKTQKWMNNLKLRIGYGVTGTANINPYSSITNTESSGVALGGKLINSYLLSQNYTNPDLTWEKSYNTNIGIDAGFLNDRINLTADYYVTRTKGIIWSRNLPASNGTYLPGSYYFTNLNICESENNGIELALNTRNIQTNDFKWNSTLTFTYNKEKIVSLQDGSSDNISNGTTGYVLSKGHAVNSFYHYKLDGVWQLGEEKDAAVFGAKPGDLKINIPDLQRESEGRYYKTDENGSKTYYDAQNKYTVSGNDYQVLGHNSPDWTMGFQNTFTYKDFDLSIFMYMRWGQMIKYEMLGRYDPSGVRNFPTHYNYWTENNPSNDFPAINANMKGTDYVGFSALNYVNGSFFKIKNITLGYSLPQNLLKKIGVEKCRFYTTITNPFIIAKSSLLKDYDPEMNGKLDYPLTKQLVFGVNLSF